MSNPRTPIDDLKLQGNTGNLRRALKRQQCEENAPALTLEQEQEIAALDALIAQTLKACKRGSTWKGKRNPAFANLRDLTRTRALLLQGRPKGGKKSAAAVLAEANAILAEAKVQ